VRCSNKTIRTTVSCTPDSQDGTRMEGRGLLVKRKSCEQSKVGNVRVETLVAQQNNKSILLKHASAYLRQVAAVYAV